MPQKIDKYKRYQQGLTILDVFPTIKGYCACGCGNKLTGRKTRWSSSACSDKAFLLFLIIKGDVSTIRSQLFEKQQGHCQSCGCYDENWQADHIHPVFMGGGGCGLDNFQTLCQDCHKEKTKEQISIRH